MKNLFILAFCFASGLLFAQNDLLPDVTVYTIDGKSLSIKDAAKDDKITVISFWATWCSPCKKELDNIAPLYESWVDELNVEMLAITVDDARGLTKVPGMVQAKGWTYTVLSDKNQDLQRALNVQNVPYTFIIKNDQIIWSHSGYLEGDENELEHKLREVAGK